MTTVKEIYKCEVCGNIVEVLHTGKGELVCCNKPMVLMTENTVDASKEKHVPVVEKEGNKVTVKVGSAEHPMEEKHYIEWVEVIDDLKSQKKFLKPGEKPQWEFNDVGESASVRAYCNLHGLWSA
jgi:superoxide reductase